jgi:hypothetical protein
MHSTSVQHNPEETNGALLQSDWRESWSLGSIVRLREPFTAWDDTSWTHGIIVEHVGRGPLGTGRVSLHLYDPGTQHIYMEHPQIPEYLDFNCEELILLKDARQLFYEWVNFHDTAGYKGLAEAFND